MPRIDSLLIPDLLAGYRRRSFRPADVAAELLARHRDDPGWNAWIVPPDPERLLARARELEAIDPASAPLYGIPFAIKDNIDLAGVPTTAGCPAYAYRPARSAPVVERLLAAGAMPVGKASLDQFATGLTGARSPLGPCRNPFDPAYVSGGSSSGSAVAVAAGLASFALGTDTAGSGRVPAAFTNLVGLKPTRGRLSARGVVPACRSLDCVSILALTAGDAARVLEIADGFDEADPGARPPGPSPLAGDLPRFRFGVPRSDQLEFHGDGEYARLFAAAVARLAAAGGEAVEVDLAPLLEAGRLLYDGAWVAERFAGVGEFVAAHPEACLPVTHAIISGGARATGADVFRTQHRLAELRRAAEGTWRAIDVLLTPTAPTIPRIAEVERDPVGPNARLGRYTHFVNLLDLAAVAVPAGFRSDGLPFGVTLSAPAWSEEGLLVLAHRLQAAADLPLGATRRPFAGAPPPAPRSGRLELAVCGAHMEGLPLSHELTARGGRLEVRTRTVPRYKLYAIAGGPPARPGLVRVDEGGAAIEVEVWSLPLEQVGGFLRGIPHPLAVGRLELEGGWVSGFVCESAGLGGARDITDRGGWRAFLAEAAPAPARH